jgi:hypothetical protein
MINFPRKGRLLSAKKAPWDANRVPKNKVRLVKDVEKELYRSHSSLRDVAWGTQTTQYFMVKGLCTLHIFAQNCTQPTPQEFLEELCFLPTEGMLFSNLNELCAIRPLQMVGSPCWN